MCGILAWRGDDVPDPELYAQMEHFAGRRGPDGHGWWLANGTVHRDLGQLNDLPEAPAGGILAHSRLSTLGSAGLDGVQPVVGDRAVLIHNGNVYNWKELAPSAATDSFALGVVYSQFRDNDVRPKAALAQTMELGKHTASAVVLWDEDGTLLAYRRHLPIWLLHHETGVYLSSGPITGSHLIPENRVLEVVPSLERSGPLATF